MEPRGHEAVVPAGRRQSVERIVPRKQLVRPIPPSTVLTCSAASPHRNEVGITEGSASGSSSIAAINGIRSTRSRAPNARV